MQGLIKHHLNQAADQVARGLGQVRWQTPRQREQLMLKEPGLVAEALLSHWQFEPLLLSTDFSCEVSKGEAAVRRLALWLSASYAPGEEPEEFHMQEEDEDSVSEE